MERSQIAHNRSQIAHNESEIAISIGSITATTDYTPELYKILADDNMSWCRADRYIKSSQLRKTLHQVVMDFYYGDEVRKQAYAKGYIIEHHNNNGLDCRIRNLSFMRKATNTYKGQMFDKLVQQHQEICTLRIFKMFSTNQYQLWLFFNTPFINERRRAMLNEVTLLYKDDYHIVFQDAETILISIIEQRSFNAEQLAQYRCVDSKLIYATQDEYQKTLLGDLKPGEMIQGTDGAWMIAMGNDDGQFCYLEEKPLDMDWPS